LFVLFLCACFEDKLLQEGDLIFHSSASSQSRAIQLATHSKYSHMGILFRKNGEWYVLEAIEPVRYTPLHIWIKRGVNSGYVVKRLKNAKKILNPGAVRKMREAGEKFLGRPYDYFFEWSDERIYCSELVWKIYNGALNIEIGEPAGIESFDFSSEEVKNKLKERFGGKIPPHHDKVISPAAMFDSPLLEKVIEK
jgi:hypothetical protein